MTAPEGGFYSALDAETDGEEGQSYVWTRDEVSACSATAPTTTSSPQVYGLTREPNFEEDRYVLLEPAARAEQAEALEDDARGARSTGSRRSAPSSWPSATVGPRRCATTRS